MNYDAVCQFLTKQNDGVDGLLEKSKLPDLVVNSSLGTTEKILQDVVKKCYDIVLDDQNLRKVLTLPLEERGKYFSRLRAEYRVRREFFHSTVNVPSRMNEIEKVLQLFGFRIKR
jgi:erythronate-4-phosphate dehydrogenase